MREKKNNWKGFALGMVIVALLAALAVPALATSGKKEMEVEYTGIHLHVDGIPITGLEGDRTPFVSGGTTYLPVRAVGEALGKVVRWDGPTHTVYISDPTAADTAAAATAGKGNTPKGKKTIEVDYLDIKLVVNGKEVTPKDVNGNVVEPFAYNGTTYLPVRAVGEALGKTVRWDGETKTVHLGETLPQATYLVDVCKASTQADEKGLVYRAADHTSFQVAGKWYSQGCRADTSSAFELGGKYESLTFDLLFVDGDFYVSENPLSIYLDGELAQTIEWKKGGGIQTVTVPLNYAQTIAFSKKEWSKEYYIANAVLHGERAVAEKPNPPENATYLMDVPWRGAYSKFTPEKSDDRCRYYMDMFGNKYTNGILVATSGPSPMCRVELNGKYKTLKTTLVYEDDYRHNIFAERKIGFSVDGELVKEIVLSPLMGSQTIEIPLNYGMELEIEGHDHFLADAILE